MRFSVGEKVTHERYGCGTIMCIEEDSSIAVDFDIASPGFHECYGHARAGHGWWVNESFLTRANGCSYEDMVI